MHSVVWLRISCLLGCLAASPTFAVGEEEASVDSRIDAIFADYDSTRTPGLVIAIHRQDRMVVHRAYGMADLEHGIANTTDTVFECGSVSKQVTAAAVVLLALDGKLQLDDDVRTHVPELPTYDDTITIRHLLNHTSGLRDWGSVAALEGWGRGTRTHDHDDVLRILATQRSLNHRPGHEYSYTNSGYNLLSIIVERISGQSLNEFCRERIFEPLGMDHTQWRDRYQRIVEHRAIAYDRVDNEWLMEMPFENVYGNGGLLTTAEDLIKFTLNLMTGELGGPQFLEEMHRVAALADGRPTEYASGLFIREFRDLPVIEHGGATAGYRALLIRFPKNDLIISVVSNAAVLRGSTIQRVFEVFLENELAPATTDPDEKEVDAEVVERLAGTYRDELRGTLLEVTVDKDNSTRLSISGNPFVAVGDRLFESNEREAIQFDAEDGQTTIRAVITKPNGNQVRLQRMESLPEGFDKWSEYTGVFQSDDLNEAYTIKEFGGKLTLNVNRQSFSLRPKFKDGFSVAIAPAIVFHRDATGQITHLTCHSSRVWEMKFSKQREDQREE